MSRVPDTVYKGYEIFTIVVPVSEGVWSATSEIEIHGAEGEEISQGFAGPFEAHSSCLLYTSPSPRDKRQSRMPSSA